MSRPNSKASEDLAKVGDTILDPNGRNFSLHNKFNFNSGDPFCKICGESVIDEQGVWEDHLINTHGYYIVPSKASELFGQNDPSEILGGTFGTPEDTANDLYNMTSHDYSIQEYDKWDNKIIDMIGQGEPQFDPSSLDSWLRSNGVYNNDLIYDLVREWGKGTRKVGESKASEGEESLTMEKAWKEWKTGYETSKDSWLLFAKNYYPPLTQSEIEWGWKYGDGVESLASEYSIKEEFDLQDQDGKYEMLSKADLSVADATNYSTYSHSELPEEVKDSLKGDEDSYGESWSRKSSIDKIEALERLGIKQGDAIKLSGVEFEDFGEDLQGALKGDVEDARNRMKAQKAFLNKTEDDQNPTGFNNQVGGEVDNPNSEFGQNYPDYNKIGESQTSMTKYECEHCNLGFKSNESLSRHHKSIHKIASEDIDGYSVDAGFTEDWAIAEYSKEDVTQEWWNNVATPSSKARILNKTGTPVENTFGLPSYYELTQETKAYLLGLDDFSFESKASEGQFDPNVADLWDESDMSERLKILSSSGITGDFDMAINGWSNLPLDVQITLEEINVAALRGESKASEFMTELEQMKHGVWNDNFDFNQSKLYVSTPAQKRQYQMQGIPTESNGEPKYSELYDDDIYAVQEIQESPIPDQVDVYDHDTFLPVKYDEIVPDDFSYRPSTWGESKANESDTFLPRSDPLFSDEEIVGGIRKHYDTVDYYQDDRPDFNNDPDFEGNVNGINVEPSQYIQSGMDHTDYGRGDIDESKANENKTYTCDKCGKVGDSFTDMAQEECPADVNANHQIPIFGDQVKPRGIGESKASESRIDELHGELVDNDLPSYMDGGGWIWKCDYCSGFPLGAEFGSDQIRLIKDHLKSSHGITETKKGWHLKNVGGREVPEKDFIDAEGNLVGNYGSPSYEGREAKLKAGYAQCPHCSTQMSRLDWLQDHIKTSHPTKASEAGSWDNWRCHNCGEIIPKGQAGKHKDETGHSDITKFKEGDPNDFITWESKASEGSEDVYNYEYVDDKVVCKNCGMKFDNAIDDARAMKDHSEIHESLYDKEAYAHEDDLDTLMWDNENPDDKGKQWKDKKGKKQESKASESILAGRSIEEYLQEYGMTREEGEQVAEYAGMDLKELIEIGNFDEARHHRVQDMDVSYMYEESKASEDITFADQHRGIQKDMIEFIRRKGGSASELDIDREFDLLNNFNNEYKHLQALKNDGTLTSAGWQPDNSGNDGYPDGSYIYNLNESYSSESDVSFGTLSDYLGIDYSDGGDYCKICGKDLTYAKDNELLNHVNSHDDKTLLEGESKASEAGLDDHSCPECGFITSDNSDYVDHLNAHED